jgi:hypothetical protein
MSHKTFLDGLEKKAQIYVKAVDEETGSVIGQASWVFRGSDHNLIPRDGPGDHKPSKGEPVTESPKPNVAVKEHKDGQDGGEEILSNGSKLSNRRISRIGCKTRFLPTSHASSSATSPCRPWTSPGAPVAPSYSTTMTLPTN